MINAHNVCLSFGKQIVFDQISFLFNQTDRVGLVGRNGSGKTTLLKAIIDSSCLDEGTITIQKNKKIAYMPQEVVLQSDLSIFDETFTAFNDVHELQIKIRVLEATLAQTSSPELLEQYVSYQEELVALQPELLQAQTKKMLMGLGFSIAQLEQSVSSLSVGWKMRIVLAKLLLQKADFYLFDEPTNHLDLIAKEWFLDFLKSADFGFIIICHERYFLDELAEKILELEFGKATIYSGNYSAYEFKKEHDRKLLEAAYIQQQKEIERKQATIDRFKASASKAKQMQSMQKALDKVERIVLPPSIKEVRFNFPYVQQAGKIVMTVHNVSYHFGQKSIFKNVSFEIKRDQKVALIAPNGVGKTTLFNIIAGILPIQQGSVSFGYNVTHAIFAQDQNKALDVRQTMLDNVKHLCPKVTEQKIRSFLGSFLFGGNDVLKKVGVLSGGEKNRVGMVCVLLQQANLLLLDEPTNHLDIPSKEILLQALKEFSGTLLFVSHDRDFVNALATDVLELSANGIRLYHGNYDEYKYQKQLDEQTKQPVSTNTVKQTTIVSSQSAAVDHKAIQKIERKMVQLEQQMRSINESFAHIDYGTPEFDTAVQALEQLKKELKDTERTWEQLQPLQ